MQGYIKAKSSLLGEIVSGGKMEEDKEEEVVWDRGGEAGRRMNRKRQ